MTEPPDLESAHAWTRPSPIDRLEDLLPWPLFLFAEVAVVYVPLLLWAYIATPSPVTRIGQATAPDGLPAYAVTCEPEKCLPAFDRLCPSGYFAPGPDTGSGAHLIRCEDP